MIYKMNEKVLNLKRLSISELNELAGNIIDELSTRYDENSEDNNKDFVEQICAVFNKEENLEEELDSLENQKELIEDEIDRIRGVLEDLERDESNLLYEYKIGALK